MTPTTPHDPAKSETATPRTDAALLRVVGSDYIMDLVPYGPVVRADFARKLELELSEAQNQLYRVAASHNLLLQRLDKDSEAALRAELAAVKAERDELERMHQQALRVQDEMELAEQRHEQMRQVAENTERRLVKERDAAKAERDDWQNRYARISEKHDVACAKGSDALYENATLRTQVERARRLLLTYNPDAAAIDAALAATAPIPKHLDPNYARNAGF